MSGRQDSDEEKRAAAQRRVNEAEVEFQDAKNQLAICQAAANSGNDYELMKAHEQWGSAAAKYGDALASYGSLLLETKRRP
jgi:hypothetical protein